MLMLLCVQVVQTNNNESSWREKIKTTTFYCKQAKDMEVCPKKKSWLKKSNWQHLYLKFNVDCHIKTYKNHNLFLV
jgi:hypothetical protein